MPLTSEQRSRMIEEIEQSESQRNLDKEIESILRMRKLQSQSSPEVNPSISQKLGASAEAVSQGLAEIGEGITFGGAGKLGRMIGGEGSGATQKRFREEHPYTSGGLNLIGGLIPSIATAGAGSINTLSKLPKILKIGGKGISKANNLGIGEGSKGLARLLGLTAQGAIEGGLNAFGGDGNIQRGAIFGGGVGGAIPLAGATLKKALQLGGGDKFAGNIANKLLKLMPLKDVKDKDSLLSKMLAEGKGSKVQDMANKAEAARSLLLANLDPKLPQDSKANILLDFEKAIKSGEVIDPNIDTAVKDMAGASDRLKGFTTRYTGDIDNQLTNAEGRQKELQDLLFQNQQEITPFSMEQSNELIKRLENIQNVSGVLKGERIVTPSQTKVIPPRIDEAFIDLSKPDPLRQFEVSPEKVRQEELAMLPRTHTNLAKNLADKLKRPQTVGSITEAYDFAKRGLEDLQKAGASIPTPLQSTVRDLRVGINESLGKSGIPEAEELVNRVNPALEVMLHNLDTDASKESVYKWAKELSDVKNERKYKDQLAKELLPRDSDVLRRFKGVVDPKKSYGFSEIAPSEVDQFLGDLNKNYIQQESQDLSSKMNTDYFRTKFIESMLNKGKDDVTNQLLSRSSAMALGAATGQSAFQFLPIINKIFQPTKKSAGKLLNEIRPERIGLLQNQAAEAESALYNLFGGKSGYDDIIEGSDLKRSKLMRSILNQKLRTQNDNQ